MHYRVMFLPDVADRARLAPLHDAAGRGLELLVETLAEAHTGAPMRGSSRAP